MGLVEELNAEVRAATAVEQRTIGGVPWRPWDDPMWRFDTGGPVHPSRQGYGGIDGALKLQPVYSSVRILAEGVAMLPLQQFRDAGNRKVKMPPGQLLSKPSAFINNFDWAFQYVSSAALGGTAPGYITARDGYGYPTTVEWLPVEDFDAIDSKPFNPAKTRFFLAGREIPRSDLLLVRAFTIPGRTLGVSVLKYFQMLIESGMNALEYGDGWFRGGGYPPGTFKNTEYEVDDEQSNKIRRKLVRAQRNHEPLVFGRDWDYTPVTVPPEQAQFVQTMQLNATQIAAIFGVPPHRVGGTRGDSMTYSNVESENIGFVQDSLDPWLVRLETALKDCLPSAQYAQFNRDARLRMTTTDRYNAYRTARDIGIMNVNEIRDLEDKPPLPKPTDQDDYDGTDYTPLQIQVAAARGAKELIGEGAGPTGVETVGQPAKAPGKPGQLAPFNPAAPPAGNGNGAPVNGRSEARDFIPSEHPRGPHGRFAHVAGVGLVDKATGATANLSDEEYAAHTKMIEQRIGDALRNGEATDAKYAIDVDKGIWQPARARIHKEIVNDLYAKAAKVPSDGKAVISGGLGGAGKSTVLRGPAQIDQRKYLTLNPDDVKEEMARRGLVPDIDGLSPMESAPLVHEESSHIANLLAKRAYADHKNVIWDITMSSRGSVQRRIDEMRAAGYHNLTGIFVDIPVETSVERALSRHRRGLTTPEGGRYVPPAIIRKNASSRASSANREVFDALRDRFDQWKLYDNSGTGPVLVGESRALEAAGRG